MFHVQQENVKATASALALKVKRASESLQKAQQKVKLLQAKISCLETLRSQDQTDDQAQAGDQTGDSPDLSDVQQEKVKATASLLALKVKPLSEQKTKALQAQISNLKGRQVRVQVPSDNQAQAYDQVPACRPAGPPLLAHLPAQACDQAPTGRPASAQVLVHDQALACRPVGPPLLAHLPARACDQALAHNQAQTHRPAVTQALTEDQTQTCSPTRSEAKNKAGIKKIADFEIKVKEALHLEAETQVALNAAEDQQIRSREAIRQISKSYHPYDLETGQARNAAVVEESLKKEFKELLEVAVEAKLSDSSIKRIQKAKRVMIQMVATIAFFFLTIRCKVEALQLEEEAENVVLKQLIPAIYLDLVSNKSNNSKERRAIKERSRLMLALVNASDGALSHLSTIELTEIQKVAIECATIFQRSSSCVEGRNGHLSLWHHSWHRISERKLAALTTVHNYFTKRPNGTTPAERFFNKKPENLFSWLLEHVDLPARPAAKRPPPKAEAFIKLAP